MINRRDTKEAVQYWYRQDDSLYFSNMLKASVADLHGHDTARRVEQALDHISDQFRQFKAGRAETIRAPALENAPDSRLIELLTRTFLYSGKAYEEHRNGRPREALRLLRTSMKIDARICLEFGVTPIVAHYYQSRHNVCRLLAAIGRRRALYMLLSRTLAMLAGTIPTSDARIAVLLELMGIQILSYFIGAVEKGVLPKAREIPIQPDVERASHLSNNINLYNCIVRNDADAAFHILRDKDPFVLAGFKRLLTATPSKQ